MTTDAVRAAARGSDEPRRPLTPRALVAASIETGAFWPTVPSLIFMLLVILPPWLSPRTGWGTALAVTAVCLVYSALFSVIAGVRMYPRRVRIAWLIAMWLVLVPLAALIGVDVLYLVMYVLISHGVILPWRAAVPAVAVLGIGFLALDLLLHAEAFGIILAVAGIITGISIASGIHGEELRDRAERAEQRSAVLAVAAERERIGRDLHDILGHSLTTITVSAQLAQRLVDADPTASRTQLAEIERLSRQSLADVRTTASGMQHVRLAGEIASSRSVLAAAGITADAPSSLPVLTDAESELLGYAVREAVTNVVRHSRASRCEIGVEEDGRSLTVADDGRGMGPTVRRSGLRGLARRFDDAGGSITVGESPGGGTLLRAQLAPTTVDPSTTQQEDAR